jgi:hypothetical protein
MTSSRELYEGFEPAMLEMYEQSMAIIDKALEDLEARRRFTVDSQGRTVVTYLPKPPTEIELSDEPWFDDDEEDDDDSPY